jgi:large subunit ribosomal protein L25
MVTVKLEKREVFGKKNNALRRNGIVPGSISRNGQETLAVQANELVVLPFTRVSGAEMVGVELDGKTYTCVVTHVHVNPLNNKIENFSLTELTKDSHVTVSVPIEITGVSPAVKNNLGVLVFNLPELKLTVNSNNIINTLSVDISNLADTGARILVGDIPGIENHKLASEKDRTLTVVTIRPLNKVEASKQELAQAGAEGAATEEAATGEAEA